MTTALLIALLIPLSPVLLLGLAYYVAGFMWLAKALAPQVLRNGGGRQ